MQDVPLLSELVSLAALGAVFAILFITISTALKEASLFRGKAAIVVALAVSVLCIVGLSQFLGPGTRTADVPLRNDKSGIGWHTILLPYTTLAIAILLVLLLSFLLKAFRGERLKRQLGDTEHRFKEPQLLKKRKEQEFTKRQRHLGPSKKEKTNVQ